MDPYQREILTNALEQRRKEIIEYQVNIDNYNIAIASITPDDELMQPFKEHLQSLLSSTIIEQRKSQIIFNAISQQLAE